MYYEFWGQKVKVQGHSGITRWNHHCTGGLQYSASCVELDFLVRSKVRTVAVGVELKLFGPIRCKISDSDLRATK